MRAARIHDRLGFEHDASNKELGILREVHVVDGQEWVLDGGSVGQVP